MPQLQRGSISETLSQARIQADSPSPGRSPPISPTTHNPRGRSKSSLELRSSSTSPSWRPTAISTSLPCTVSVRSPEAYRELLAAIPGVDPRANQPDIPGKKVKSPEGGVKNSKAAAKSAEMRRLLGIKDAKQHEQLQRSIRNSIHKARTSQQEAQEKRLKAIEDEQAGFVTDTENFLQRKESEERMHQKTIHNMWMEQVHEPIEAQVAKQLTAIDCKELSARLGKAQEDYIQTVNRKFVFRDIVMESDYDPFTLKDHVIKADTAARDIDHPEGIVDPLLEQIDKVMEIHQGKEDSIRGGGRDIFPVCEWNKAEVTPIGFAAKQYELSQKPLGSGADRPGVRAQRSNEITAGMDHYGYVRGSAGSMVARAEAPLGKKMLPKLGAKG